MNRRWLDELMRGLLSSIALIACVVPARRAARVAPMQALRQD